MLGKTSKLVVFALLFHVHASLSSSSGCENYYTSVNGYHGFVCRNKGLMGIPPSPKPAVHMLHLDSNKLKEIKNEAFLKAGYGRNLTVLNLNRNQISVVSSGAFEGLSGVRDLSLQYNNLTYISGEIFSPMVKLQQLYLSNNPLKAIQGEVSFHLHLSGLDLHNCNIDNLEDVMLYNSNGQLAWFGTSNAAVELDNNNITCISDNLATAVMNTGAVLSLGDNPLLCTCIPQNFVHFDRYFEGVSCQ